MVRHAHARRRHPARVIRGPNPPDGDLGPCRRRRAHVTVTPMGPIQTRGATLLGAPRVPESTVGRPRLDRALDHIPPGGIALVVAPAGSGKSVLLGQWMRGSAARACHVQVTPAHDDPVVFARALTSAIAAVAPDFDPGVAESVAAAGRGLGDGVREQAARGHRGARRRAGDRARRRASAGQPGDLDRPGSDHRAASRQRPHRAERPMGPSCAAPIAPTAVSGGRDPS